jgi:hypothetical protein
VKRIPKRAFPLGLSAAGTPLYIDDETRTTSMQVIGSTGTGKTKFIEALVREDILRGNGVALIDPHGHLTESVIRWCARKGIDRWRKVLVLDPGRSDFLFGFNPLDYRRYAGRGDEPMTLDFILDAVMRAVQQAWRENEPKNTPQLRRCLYDLFCPLAELNLTLEESLLLIEPGEEGKAYRERLGMTSKNVAVAREWRLHNASSAAEMRALFNSSVGRLFEALKTPLLCNILGQERRNIDFLRLMDERWVVLVNLSSRGRLSADNARFLGALLVNDLFLAARCRDEKTGKAKPFFVYIDECAEFINEDVAKILTEGRKFGVHLTLAHQDLSQLKREGERVEAAVMGAARTKVVFSLQHPDDADVAADLLFTGEYDLEEPKRSLIRPTVVGMARTILAGASHSTSASYGSASTSGLGATVTRNAEGMVVGEASNTSGTEAQSDAMTESDSWGWSEGLEPIYRDLPTQVLSLEEQVHRAVARIMNQPQRHAFVKMPAKRSVQIRVPVVRDAFATEDLVELFKRRNGLREGMAATIEEIERDRALRQARIAELAFSPSTEPELEPETWRE